MRLGTALDWTAWAACTALGLFLAFTGCSAPTPETPTPVVIAPPLPSKAAFSEQVLEPLAVKAAGEHVKQAQANAAHLISKWKKEHPQGGSGLPAIIGSVVGGAAGGPGGAAIGGALGKAFAEAQREDPDAVLAEMLAWTETRRLPVTAKYLTLFESRLQESGEVYSVCTGGKERRYQRAAGFPRLDDGSGPCPTTKISLRD